MRRLRSRTRTAPSRRLWQNSWLRRSYRKKRTLSEPKEWKSWKLRKVTLLTLLGVTLVFVVGILALLTLSNIRNGFTAVRSTPLRYGGINISSSIAWTFPPSLVLQIYGLCVASVTEAFGFRQPFVELARGAIAKKSIALDYQSYFPIQREIKALRRGHWHLGLAFFLSLLSKVSLGPLAAHMLIAQDYDDTQSVKLQQNYAFHVSSELNDSLGWDLSPVLGVASSTLVYGGAYPRWSDGTYTFLNFSVVDPPLGSSAQSIVRADTQAYSARLDCEVMDHVVDHLTRIGDSQDTDSNTGRWFLNGTDHDCDWKTSIQISEGFETYLQTSSHVNCSSYENSPYTGRLVVVGVSNVDFNKSLPTVVSCVPTYWGAWGNLTMSLDQDSRRPIIGFDLNVPEELRPQWWASFETQLSQVLSVDTTGSGGISSDSATAFGKIILENARRLDGDNPLSGEVLTQSAQQAFQAAYSVLVDTFMIRHTDQESEFRGQLIVTEHKLFVDNTIAGIILGLLVAVAMVLIMIHLYTNIQLHRSVLFEEPVGILGYAGLLTDSVVNNMVVAIRETERYRGKTAEDGMAVLEKGVNTPSFIAVDIDNPRTMHISMRVNSGSAEDAEEAFIRASFPPRQRENSQQTIANSGATSSTDGLVHGAPSLISDTGSGNMIELRETRGS